MKLISTRGGEWSGGLAGRAGAVAAVDLVDHGLLPTGEADTTPVDTLGHRAGLQRPGLLLGQEDLAGLLVLVPRVRHRLRLADAEAERAGHLLVVVGEAGGGGLRDVLGGLELVLLVDVRAVLGQTVADRGGGCLGVEDIRVGGVVHVVGGRLGGDGGGGGQYCSGHANSSIDEMLR